MGDIIKIGKRNVALVVYQVSSCLTQELLNEMNQVADQGKVTKVVQSEIKNEQKHTLQSMRECTQVFHPETKARGKETKWQSDRLLLCESCSQQALV